MKSRQDKITEVWNQYQQIKKSAYKDYENITDAAFKKYSDMHESLLLEKDKLTLPTPNISYLQIKDGEVFYKYDVPICIICNSIIKTDERVTPNNGINFNANMIDMVHKSCKEVQKKGNAK